MQVVVIVYVALRAGHVRVAIGERESCGAVIEFHLQPVVCRVAEITGGRETCAGVIGVSRFLEIR